MGLEYMREWMSASEMGTRIQGAQLFIHHENSVVGFKSVDFVEKVTAGFSGDQAVEVLEDQKAGRHKTGVGENFADGEFHRVTLTSIEGLYVESGNWVFASTERVNQRLDGDRLAVPWDTV